MHRGWVRLYRKIADNPLWTADKFTRGQAWVDLIMIANHKDNYIRVRGVRVEVKRGQVAHSEGTLAKRWGWSKGKVRRFLSELQKDSMIEHQKNNVINLIIMKNYDLHQSDGNTNGNTNGKTDSNTDGLQTVIQTDTNNKDKKVNAVKNVNKLKTLCPDSLSLAGLLADLIIEHSPDHRELQTDKKDGTLKRWAYDIDLMQRIDKREPQNIEAVIKWAQNDTFWHKNILSGSTLRKKFDRLFLEVNKMTQKVSNVGIQSHTAGQSFMQKEDKDAE